jgi:D-cysteine desulfhydrase
MSALPSLPAGLAPVARARPRIFDALPGLAHLPWIPLAHLPTPVERITAIADWLGRDDLWMKRDDLASPLYGGNKVRRYEFVLADAFEKGKKRIVTAGGLASTQAMATALFGRAVGMPVKIVLFDQPITRFAKEALLVDADAGAELVWGGGYLTTIFRTWRALGKDSYLILPGASNPLANIAYIDAMLELADQVARGEMPRPDAIVLPTGSSGTLAALALGAAHLGWDTEIIGVRITLAIACNRFTVGQVMRATDRYLARMDPAHWKRQSARARYALYGDALGEGYGYPTADAVEGIEQMRRLTGQPGEVTYSGKALAGLRAIAREARWKGKTILLWNTLSTPRPSVSSDAKSKVPERLRFVLEASEVA